MENKNAPTFTLTIVAIIVGAALYKQFDFQTLTFQKPALAIVYMLVFVFSVYVLIRNYRKQPGK
jgi:positive regulator of sigma E activity